MPPVPDAVRAAFRERAEGMATEALHAELAGAIRRWRTAAPLRPDADHAGDRGASGNGAVARRVPGRARTGPLACVEALRLFVSPEREAVRAAIDRRFEAMMAQGALDEVKRLKDRGLDPLLPVMRAHGVPGLIAHLDGAISLDEAIARGQADTRAYAKRQVTWFRHQMAGWEAVAPDAALGIARARLRA